MKLYQNLPKIKTMGYRLPSTSILCKKVTIHFDGTQETYLYVRLQFDLHHVVLLSILNP